MPAEGAVRRVNKDCKGWAPSLFAVIRAYLDDLHSGRFVFRPSWGCASCEFCDGACKAWAGG